MPTATAVVELVGSLVVGADWMANLSVFHYMAPAPARSVDVPAALITLSVAAALLGVATFAFTRHDLQAG